MGAPKNNVNAVKHGKYSKKDILICATCAAQKRCDKFNPEKPNTACYYEKRLEKPDLSSVDNMVDFLKEIITMDFLRLQRCFVFERLQGGLIDSDAIKLEIHITNVARVIAKLIEITEIQGRVEELEKRLGVKS